MPPVVNDAAMAELLAAAADSALGAGAAVPTEQSLGGEDFAWYLQQVPGAMARLGVRPPGSDGPLLDLHRGDSDVDDGPIAANVRVLVARRPRHVAGMSTAVPLHMRRADGGASGRGTTG